MGLVEHSGAPMTLAAHCVVGRSAACAFVLADPRVSSEHARIFWREDRWHVRDLGSRNGTFVNGARLGHGEARALARGDALAFGDPTVALTLVDDAPPVALARPLGGGALVIAEDGILAIFAAGETSATDESTRVAGGSMSATVEPAPAAGTDTLAVCVLEDANGQWIAEQDGQSRSVRDGDVVHVGAIAYALHLPSGVPATMDARDDRLALRAVDLRLRVSRDEERVEVTLAGRGQPRVIPPRAHHYTLLTLARTRIRDEETDALPEPSRGWLAVDDLCRMLATDETRLNVEVYRIRKDIARAGVCDAAAVIERRRGSRELRLGTHRVAIAAMG